MQLLEVLDQFRWRLMPPKDSNCCCSTAIQPRTRHDYLFGNERANRLVIDYAYFGRWEEGGGKSLKGMPEFYCSAPKFRSPDGHRNFIPWGAGRAK